uniref:Uncharacterized protein n=1 Tax=Anguilla anguilla TaxID=7936 RepID=A0A0E9WXG2_ANGAN
MQEILLLEMSSSAIYKEWNKPRSSTCGQWTLFMSSFSVSCSKGKLQCVGVTGDDFLRYIYININVLQPHRLYTYMHTQENTNTETNAGTR